MLLGLIGFPHGRKTVKLTRRNRFRSPAGQLIRRLPCTWLLEQWGLEKLDTTARLQLEAQPHSAHRHQRYHMSAVALVAPGTINEGPLTAWNDEERLLMHYNSHPADTFSLQVLQVAALVESTEVFMNVGVAHEGVFTLPAPFLDQQASCTGQQQRPVHELCVLWGVPVPDAMAACFVPELILGLILSARWSTLLLRACKHTLHPFLPLAFPPQEWRLRLQTHNLLGKFDISRWCTKPEAYGKTFWVSLLEQVREWALCVKRDMETRVPVEEVHDAMLNMTNTVVKLQRFIADVYEPGEVVGPAWCLN